MTVSVNQPGEEAIIWDKTAKPESCALFHLKEKTVVEEEFRCEIIRRSVDKRYALIRANTTLEVRTNVMLKKERERKYAKVLRQEEEGYIICFTSVNQSN